MGSVTIRVSLHLLCHCVFLPVILSVLAHLRVYNALFGTWVWNTSRKGSRQELEKQPPRHAKIWGLMIRGRGGGGGEEVVSDRYHEREDSCFINLLLRQELSLLLTETQCFMLLGDLRRARLLFFCTLGCVVPNTCKEIRLVKWDCDHSCFGILVYNSSLYCCFDVVLGFCIRFRGRAFHSWAN